MCGWHYILSIGQTASRGTLRSGRRAWPCFRRQKTHYRAQGRGRQDQSSVSGPWQQRIGQAREGEAIVRKKKVGGLTRNPGLRQSGPELG